MNIQYVWFIMINITMDNEFDQWNIEKKHLNENICKINFKEKDIFFIKMWKNIRYEQNWKWPNFLRPVLVIKKFNKDIFWWLALTSKQKDWLYYYSFFVDNKPQCAILSQIRLYDKNRLYTKIWMISENDFVKIKEKIKSIF